jgi:hypothetical protein
MHTKFLKDWFRLSKVDRGAKQTYRQHGDLIILLLFVKNEECRLKWE